ncbi:hypothetical protein [Bacillus sp. FSL K6-3431]|uniref:hypothetical protein n=1 Tax=Bacillus sp. FSL K6-3431 TaxID=2921500 RepID=UPI0030F6D891
MKNHIYLQFETIDYHPKRVLQFGMTAQDAEVKLDPFKLYNCYWAIISSIAINQTFSAYHWMKEGRIKR